GDFVVLAIAHGKGAHRLFGKRSDGTLPLWRWLVFLPLLVYMWAIWHLMRIVKHEPARSVVTGQLVIGRRLLASELDEKFDNYVDLTAEFAEPSIIRRSPAYRSFPILNDAAPSPEALRAAIYSLRPGRTFVHCGRGWQGRVVCPGSAAYLGRGHQRRGRLADAQGSASGRSLESRAAAMHSAFCGAIGRRNLSKR